MAIKGVFHIFIICIGLTSISYSQPWIDGAIEANGELNFFKTQELFNEFWKDKTPEKGQGYNAYRRWEQYWQYRVDENGYLPSPGLVSREWQKFQFQNPSQGIRAGAWQSVGPTTSTGGYAGIGRLSAIAFHPTNANIMWVGTPGGGIWKSVDGGTTWTTNTDFILANLGVSGIVINPNDPNIMYIATGDADGGNTYSLGVLKSTDGGTTWSNTGLTFATTNYRQIKKLIIDSNDSNTLIAATTNGIYRTTNAGSTWTQEATGSFQDLVEDPTGTNNTFYSSQAGSIWKSTNNGDTWSSIYTISGSNRIALAVTPANTSYVYAISSKSADNGFNGLFRSTNSGSSFTSMSTTPNILGYSSNGSEAGGQGWYDLCIAANPLNAETIIIGGVNTWKSTNGGTTWSLNSFWYNISGVPTMHADKHLFAWQNNTTLWSGNDGGIYRSGDSGTTWTDKSNTLVISQMYRLGVAQTDTKVVTGLQDNGTKMRSTSGTWSDILGGDGMECAINPINSNIIYASSQYGNLNRSTNGGSSFTNIKNNISSGLQGAWITPHTLNPSRPATIYAAYANLYKSVNQGTNWTIIGPTTAIGTSNKTLLQVAKSDSNYIYVGTSSRISRTTNGGSTWSDLLLPTTSITSIAVHPTKPNTIFITASNFTAGSKVFKSIDGGTTWTNISANLPNVPFNTVKHNDDLLESIYVGGDIGVYYINNDMNNWVSFSDLLPNVEIFELDINYLEDKIYAATYGRGLWKSDLFTPPAVSCYAPVDVIAIPGYKSAAISWTAPAIAPSGYEVAITTSATPPASGVPISNTSTIQTNLTHNAVLYAHVRSTCSNNTFSIWKTVQFKTSLSCGDVFVDSGGTTGNYSNNENSVVTICPQTIGFVNLTFTSFSTELNYDALYLFNGNTLSSPLIPSTAGVLTSGFPAGGYHGTNNPGTIASSHSSGCLTTIFRSDNGTTSTGWSTSAITCSVSCVNTVTNTNDSGPGSLRNAAVCSSGAGNILFDNSLLGQTITLTSGPIVITNDLTISPNAQLNIKFASAAGAIFSINSSVNVIIENSSLLASTNGSNRAIINNGNLTLKDVSIIDSIASSSINSTILNTGNVSILGNVQIKNN